MRSTVDKRIKTILDTEFIEEDSKVIYETQKQIDEYLFGEGNNF